jgi:poly(3-hydroxybutyrate) depolymerase
MTRYLFLRKGRLLCLFLYAAFSMAHASAQDLTQTPVTKDVNYAIGGFYECLPPHYDKNGAKKYPLLIFIHGIGELGDGSPSQLKRVLRNGVPKLIENKTLPNSFTVNGESNSFLIISPQFRKNYRDAAVVSSLIDYCVANYRVDESRIYLTGLSMGGGISWVYAAKSATNAKRLAAMLVVCGNTNASSGGIARIASSNLPVWATHSSEDPVVSSSNSINWINGLNAYTPAINPKALLTLFNSKGHDAWSKTYNPDFKPNGLNVYQWLLSHKRDGAATPPNIPPVADAGSDITITLPTNSVSLAGTATDADGSIATYAWTKVNGPAAGTINSPNAATTAATALQEGTYTFRLTVSDKAGATGSDEVNVTVKPAPNKAPVANAGSDKNITVPANSVLLAGTATDGDGHIIQYNWSKVSGPIGGTIDSPGKAATTVSALREGTYFFRLMVTDNAGATGTDEVEVSVKPAPNKAPTANAGSDKSITLPVSSVTLSGTATDADGTITKIKWTKISGPDEGTIDAPDKATTTASALIEGVYLFRLTITDNTGATGTDEVEVMVKPAPNQAPVSAAGADQTITLPANSVTLNGLATDSDGTIATYSWAKISGRAATITASDSATTTVTGLVQGTYVFKLTITDDKGATGNDEVTITVNAAPNVAPKADAGVDQTIILPANSVTLSGSGTDSDGTVTGYSWTKRSGPAAGTITSPGVKSTTVMGLVEGSYVFRLTVTDNDSATATDDVAITVNAASNKAPVANAGADQSITLPANSVNLNGTATDSDGTIQAVNWRKTEGPVAGSIASPADKATTVTGLAAGTYTFRFTATDNTGASNSDFVKITVNAEKPVFAKAGKDTLIYKNQTRPDTVVLNGMASVGGTSYNWRKISGPGATVIADTSAPATYAIGLQEGMHIFGLDLDGKAQDTIQVVVRDWQKKNVNPCRPGGGKSFVVPESAPGQYNYRYINRDNALGERVMGGDTLYFKGGAKTAFEIGDFGGGPGCPVYIMPMEEALVITDGYFRVGTHDSNVVQHAVLDGTVLRGKGIPYGFFIDNKNVPDNENNYSGLVASWVAHFTVKGYRSINTGTMQIKLDAKEAPYGRYDKFIQKRIRIQDNFIEGSKTEGLYIGHTASNGGQLNNPYGPPPRMDSVEITNNIIINCGWDGIQLANARTAAVIKHNFVYKTGLLNKPAQRSGILMGANTTGTIDSNIVINSKGIGIQVLGYGVVNVQSNIIDSIYGGSSNQDGIYESHIAVLPETGNIPLSVTNNGNLISRVERKHIKIANNTGTMIPGRTYNNTFIDPVERADKDLVSAGAGDLVDNNEVIAQFPFQVNKIGTKKETAYISMTQGDAAKSFTTVKAAVDWLFRRLISVSDSNEAPVASAGTDQIITLPQDSVFLEGSGKDKDGTVVGYQWRMLSGPAGAIINTSGGASASVTQISKGVYTLELAITDNGKATGRDTVAITVKAAPKKENKRPHVYAGTDSTINLPVNTIVLKGTAMDEDGTVTNTKWTKLSGPGSYSMTDKTGLQITLDSLVQGVYQFELSATDNEGATVQDTVYITVAAEEKKVENRAPVAAAGNDQTVQLPINTTTLNGTGSDGDGYVGSYRWEQLSGPETALVENRNAAITDVTGLVTGIYYFELTVTDNSAAATKDTLLVTVLPKPNVLPVADAGVDQTIQLPVDSVVLDGNGTDQDGSIVAFNWTSISGSRLQDSIPVTAKPVLRNLKKGTYYFRLQVTDNEGATAADTVKITVKAAAPQNKAPEAFAGHDLEVQLPQNSAVLHGSGADADGTVKSYHWKQHSGPSTATFGTPQEAQTAVNGLIEGIYQIEMTVTDNEGAVAADTVLLTVKAALLPARNEAPVVAAGNNIVLTLPVNATTISGAATDYDGTVASYQWTKIWGPASFKIAAPQAAKTEISNLVKGMYYFELKATDNQGAISRDTLVVTVAAPVRPLFTIDAGKDNVIMLPADGVTLESTVIDPYHMVQNFSWKKLSGPKQHQFDNANAARTHLTNLAEGIYQFACTAADEYGNRLTDTVQVRVEALAKSNATIFPNPSNGSFVNILIQANTRTSKMQVTVYNMNGRPMQREAFIRTKGTMSKALNISKLPAGIYTVEIEVDINTKISTILVKL